MSKVETDIKPDGRGDWVCRISFHELDGDGAQAAPTDGSETKRDYVRRLLFAPLDDAGIAPNPKLTERAKHKDCDASIDTLHREFLDKLADNLGHQSPEALTTLSETILYNTIGDGKSTRGLRLPRRGCWPSRIEVLDWANRIEPFPIDRIPGLKGWFGSIEGPKALNADCAVETYKWILKHKRPPYRDADRLAITEAAAQRRREIEVMRDRLKRFPGDASAQNTVKRYEYQHGRVLEIIREFRGDKGLLV